MSATARDRCPQWGGEREHVSPSLSTAANSINQSINQSVGRSVGRSVARSVGQSQPRSQGLSLGGGQRETLGTRLSHQSVNRSVGQQSKWADRPGPAT